MRKISDFNGSTEKYPVIYAGSATRPEYVDMPTILQQQEGVAPLETCPAQWWNAMWKLATKDINAFRDFVGDAFTEINNLLVKFNITLDNADSEQLYDFFHDDYVQNYLSTIFVNKTGDTIDGDLHIKGDLSVDGIGEEIISTELKVGSNTITLRNDNPSALGNTELAGVVTKNYDGNNHNNIIAIDKNGVARTGDINIATRILYSNGATNFYTDESLTTPAVIGATEEVRDTGNQTGGGVEIYEGITYSNNDTQPLLSRAESNAITNGHYLIWDAANKRAVDGGGAIDMFYPVGSLYWTGKAPNDGGDPNVLFGGTWVQIKDRFVLAAGDTYTAGSTGGTATVTLTEAQMPSHSHTSNVYHRHYVSGNTENMNNNATGSFQNRVLDNNCAIVGAIYGQSVEAAAGKATATGNCSASFISMYGGGGDAKTAPSDHAHRSVISINVQHYHGFTGWSNTGIYNNSDERIGGDGTWNVSTDSKGTGDAHENMPPYIVKYCWERTA